MPLSVAVGISVNGNRKNLILQNWMEESFVLDDKYYVEKVIYATDYYVVAEGTEYHPIPDRNKGIVGYPCHQTAVRKIEIKKYRDLLGRNWNWNLSFKVLNELKVYNTLKDQTKMVSLVDIMLPLKFKGSKDEYRKIFNRAFRDMYLVFERCGEDLSCILSRRKKEPLLEMMNTTIQQQWLLSELLSAVSSLHSQKLLHRDLRPSNVSVDFEEKSLKLKNFGLSSGFSSEAYIQEDDEVHEDVDEDEDEDEDEDKKDYDEKGKEKTDDEITPIYTAPEIILGRASTPSVDVWGVGCIFAEILSGGSRSPPLFFVASGSKPTTPNKIGAIVLTLETEGSLDKLSSNPLAIDLLRRMLVFNPANRISLEEAKQHSYFVGGSSSSRVVVARAEEEEDIGVVEVTVPEVVEPDEHGLRKMIWNEMETFEMNNKKTSEILLPLVKKQKTLR